MLAWHKEFHTSVTGALQQEEARTLENWAKEMRADRDFGGSRWKATVADARRALDAFDVDGSLRALLRDSRYQYNPTVIFDEGTPEEVLIVKDGKVVCLGD